MYDAILSGVIGPVINVQSDLNLLSYYMKLLNSGGQLLVKTEIGTEEKLTKHLKICGFLNASTNDTPGIVVGNKPTYNVNNN